MRTLAFKYKDRIYNLDFPGIGNGSFLKNLLELSDYMHSLLLYVFVFMLPLSVFLYRSSNIETTSFFISVIFIVLISGFYLVSLTINYNNRLLDASGLINILIFALLTTLSAVLVTPPDAANTFGTVGSAAHKSLSGLSVIMFIAIYYFLNLNLRNLKQFKWVYKALTFGISISLLVFLFDSGIRPEAATIPLVFVLALILNVIFVHSRKLYFLPLVIAGLAVISKYEFNTSAIFFILFTFTTAILIPYLILVVKNRYLVVQNLNDALDALADSVVSDGAKLKINFQSIKAVFVNLIKAAWVLLLPILVIMLIAIALGDKQSTNIFESGVNVITDAINDIKDNTQQIIVGKGTSNANDSDTFFGAIIVSHGILGVIAYAFLFVYSLTLQISLLRSNKFQNKGVFQRFAIASVIISNFILVSGFFLVPGYLLTALWWINFSILLAINTFISRESISIGAEQLYEVTNLKIFNRTLTDRNSRFGKIALSFFVIFLMFALIYISFSLKGEII